MYHRQIFKAVGGIPFSGRSSLQRAGGLPVRPKDEILDMNTASYETATSNLRGFLSFGQGQFLLPATTTTVPRSYHSSGVAPQLVLTLHIECGIMIHEPSSEHWSRTSRM